MWNLTTIRNFFPIACMLLMLWTKVSQSTGYFEVQLISVENVKGELANGECCDGFRGSQDLRCTRDECDTYFKVCLKEYQMEVTTSGSCTFGAGSTQVLGGNMFSFKNSSEIDNTVIPFQFAWPLIYTLIVEAWDWDNDTRNTEEEQLIERSIHTGFINPGDPWQMILHDGPVARIIYRIRVRCDKNYYRSTCNIWCSPRDDNFGHYRCGPSGNHVCLDGWMGRGCTTAMCKQGCNLLHGMCTVPGECKCSYGWQGEFCDECVTYPGCVHGTCSMPWQCICERNWTGLLCDKAFHPEEHLPTTPPRTLHYEASSHPVACKQGCNLLHGTCSVPGECKCSYGWQGEFCDECVTHPGCVHGTCSMPWQCICERNWTGLLCDKAFHPEEHLPTTPPRTLHYEASSHPVACKQGCNLLHGTCSVPGECKCSYGWQGEFCDECVTHPGCVHGTCSMPWQCICERNWTGLLCDKAFHPEEHLPTTPPRTLHYEASSHPVACKQGCNLLHGTCSVPGECKCSYGWQGEFCDECVTHPGCVHGTCSMPWQCICERNWTGLLCDKAFHPEEHLPTTPPRTLHYEASSHPVACKQGCNLLHGTCSVPGECKCSYGWQGEFCDECVTHPGCVHGTCSMPWQCICERNWTGLLCDKAFSPEST
ncbi:protein jagged-2-like isoform X2 [Archocentrus centrarchus]|uniref:protein jagged-2-like isoform X2 n=1 Tax=Archocentrus centrarchus TaxID=63155 RepID=UPI0011E9CE8F|nr:protein jagged-2-like isoform X2 [Archocentrus centrarchus]